MKFMNEYWLSILVGLYLLTMVLYGHYRGFIRIAVSMVALSATLFIARAGMPYVTGYLKENTAIQKLVEDNIMKMSGLEAEAEAEEQAAAPGSQRRMIEGMDLPEMLKQILIKNNNHEIYQILGVEAFSEYIAGYLSNLIFNMVGFILMFILTYIFIRMNMKWLNLFSKLPVVHGINQIAGAIVGGLEGLAVLWFLSLIVTVFAGTGPGRVIIAQIESSSWLSFLYGNNIFQWVITSVLGNVFR